MHFICYIEKQYFTYSFVSYSKRNILVYIGIVILITTHSLYAQTKITGAVRDTVGNPIKDVTVRLYTESDTSISITNALGIYRLPAGRSTQVRLSYNMLGYLSEQMSYQLDNHDVVLPDVILKKVAYQIQDVPVTRVVPMVINGDTIQYNLEAFTFRKQTLLEDGLKKIPGFQ